MRIFFGTSVPCLYSLSYSFLRWNSHLNTISHRRWLCETKTTGAIIVPNDGEQARKQLADFCYSCSKYMARPIPIPIIAHGCQMSSDGSRSDRNSYWRVSYCLTTFIMDYCMQWPSFKCGYRPVYDTSFKPELFSTKSENHLRIVLSAIAASP